MKVLLLTITFILSSCGKSSIVFYPQDKKNNLVETRMSCDVFNIGPGVPNFDNLYSMGKILVSQLDNPQNGTSSPFIPFLNTEFEASYRENFALKCTGDFTAEVSGIHNIYLDSDDGSTLSLNDVNVIDNNGDHSMVKKSSNIMLLAGTYKMSVTYYNHIGLKGLILSVKRPNRSKEEVIKF